MNIYPTDGNPKIAALIMAFALFRKDTKQNIRDSILKAQVDRLSFSFSSQEKAKDFVESLGTIARCYINDLTVDVMPAYSSVI